MKNPKAKLKWISPVAFITVVIATVTCFNAADPIVAAIIVVPIAIAIIYGAIKLEEKLSPKE